MPREHAGLGTLIVPGFAASKVVLQIAPDDSSGWQTVRGTISGDPAVLAAAFQNNREARLVHDATGFEMHLTIVDVLGEEARVTLDASRHQGRATKS